jgi:hypothetical protein
MPEFPEDFVGQALCMSRRLCSRGRGNRGMMSIARPRPSTISAIRLILLCGTSLLTPAVAWAQVAQPTVEQLQQEIKKRDAVIDNLLRRVENLERRVGTAGTVARGGRAAVERTVATQPPAESTEAPASEPRMETAAAAPASSPPPTEQQAPTDQPSPPQGAAQQAPGQFHVDVQAAERALERTLTATGALLVPAGFAEVEPAFGYTRREIPNLVLFTNNRNEFVAAGTVRVGLPWESQIDIGVPYNVVESQLVDNFVSPQQQVSSATGNSFGDVTVGLSKTILHESGWVPDLIGRISYEIPTGPVLSNRVALPGSGQSRLGISATALRRQDPLAFVASIGYLKAFDYENINPGDQLVFLGGVYLATSPETTLRGVLQQAFVQAPRIGGVTVSGGNSVQSVLTFGASSTLGRGVLLDLQVGVGLTRDAPKYSVIVSLPVRFGVPWL